MGYLKFSSRLLAISCTIFCMLMTGCARSPSTLHPEPECIPTATIISEWPSGFIREKPDPHPESAVWKPELGLAVSAAIVGCRNQIGGITPKDEAIIIEVIRKYLTEKKYELVEEPNDHLRKVIVQGINDQLGRNVVSDVIFCCMK